MSFMDAKNAMRLALLAKSSQKNGSLVRVLNGRAKKIGSAIVVLKSGKPSKVKVDESIQPAAKAYLSWAKRSQIASKASRGYPANRASRLVRVSV